MFLAVFTKIEVAFWEVDRVSGRLEIEKRQGEHFAPQKIRSLQTNPIYQSNYYASIKKPGIIKFAAEFRLQNLTGPSQQFTDSKKPDESRSQMLLT